MPIFTEPGIEEAPNDGQQYARQSLGWTIVAAGGGVQPDDDVTWTGNHDFIEPVQFASGPTLKGVSAGSLGVRDGTDTLYATMLAQTFRAQSHQVYSGTALDTAVGTLRADGGVMVFDAYAGNTLQIKTTDALATIKLSHDTADSIIAGALEVNIRTNLKIGNSDPYTLPFSDGQANQILVTDGAGAVTWQNNSGGGGGEANRGENVGGFSESYVGMSGVNLQFRTLQSSDTSVSITQNATDIDFKASAASVGAASQAAFDAHTGDQTIHWANPMTTASDLIYGGSSGIPQRLPVGADGQVLTSNGGAISWAAASGVDLAASYAWTGTHTHGQSITFTSSAGDSAPAGTAATLDLTNNNHVSLDVSGASGTVAVTVTIPANRGAGTIVVSQGATQRNITWAASSGSVKWLGTQPTWDDAGEASKDRIVSWHWDGSTLRLMASSNG